MPGITASSWMPALLTTIWIGPSTSNVLQRAGGFGVRSVTSKATARAEPPAAVISALTRSAWCEIAVGVHVDMAAISSEPLADGGADGPAAAGDECAFHPRSPV